MNKQCIFIALLTAITLCNAMNETIKNIPAKILMKLNTSKEFNAVICLSNNLVALKGPNHCSLFDISSNKEIKGLEEKQELTHVITISTDPYKKLLAMIDNDDVIIYDVLTQNKILEENIPYNDRLAIFDPITPGLLIRNRLSGWNEYIYTDFYSPSQPTKRIPGDHKIIFNPIKDEYITYTIHQYPATLIKHNNKKNTKKKYPIDNSIQLCKYSPDGSLLAMQNSQQTCSILDLKTSEQTDLDLNETYINTIVFNPHSFILAILMKSRGKSYEISYWNTKTKKLLTSTTLKNFHFFSTNDQSIDFYNETTIIAAQSYECLMYEVPFEALYQPDTKEKCALALWILKNYKDEHGNNILPQELTHLLINKLLETCKYSFTNY